ncbi:Serpentine receptor class T-55 [Toxocara canis]|uniref:Serpentine receptor class T-55 n=1 Tax=Toxocara canis TaxID=6265 RepID=A0A0B2VI49_TOXCA|nr:Serpentine receptor class T-55 [Toxocara canis]
MLAMCVTDVLSLSFSGIFTGFLSIIGASICSHPVLLSIGGHVGFGLWCCYAMLCTILGLNRFLDLLYPMFYRPLFSGRRTWYWLSLPVLYGLYISSPLERPFIYSSRLGSWFISPLPGVLDTGYTQTVTSHTVTNVSVSLVITMLYAYIYLHLRRQSKQITMCTSAQVSSARMRILVQTFVTCLILTVATASYVAMQLWPLPDFMYILSQITWQAINGSNSIIYLCLNRTIRRRLKAKLCGSISYSDEEERRGGFSFTFSGISVKRDHKKLRFSFSAAHPPNANLTESSDFLMLRPQKTRVTSSSTGQAFKNCIR